jgi:transcription elongation factor SPT6
LVYKTSDENEIDEDTRRERIARRKERHEFAKNLGADHGISDNAWRDIEELFGDGMDYPHALYLKNNQEEYPQEEYDGEVSAAVTKKREISLKDVYEPSEIAEKMLTEKDEKIRVVDMPERYQFLDAYSPDDNEIGREATIITKSLIRDRTNLTEQAIHASVSSVLRFLRRDKFEVPFIWAHRRDYFNEILQLADLWAILDWDTKFIQVELKKKSLLELIAQVF